MRLSPSLALAAAILWPVTAGAVVCKVGMFDPPALVRVCGPRNTQEQCQAYQTGFLQACSDAHVESERNIERLKAIKNPTPAEKIALKQAEAASLRQIAALSDASHAAYLARAHSGASDGGAIPGVVVYNSVPNFLAIQSLSGFDLQVQVKATVDRLLGADEPSENENQLRSETTLPQPKPEVKRGGLPDGARQFETDANRPGEKPDPKQLEQAGQLYLAAGKPGDAERVGREAVKADPGGSAGYSLLARAALGADKPGEAAEWARGALKLDPADRDAKKALAFAESILSRSRLKGPAAKPGFEDTGGTGPGAFGAGYAAKSVSPASLPAATPEAAPLNAPPYMKLARRKAALGDLGGALTDLTLALDQSPDDEAARLQRAEISLAMNNPDSALADAERVLAKRPNDPRALRAKASALLQLGRLEEALAVIERAVALEPLAAAGHLTRAMILEKLGRAADAAAEFREAARLDPALTPVAQEALRRLGLGPAGPAGSQVQRRLLRGGMIALSLALVCAGLIGGAVKLRTRRARAATGADRPGAPREITTGDLVAGQYRIARELGRGGMGVVFEAVDETLKRPVALKLMQAEMMTDEDAARFLQEARLIAQLKHPNIAEIHAAVNDGGLFLVFELVEGRTLDQVLGQGGTMPPEEARRVIGDLCAGLACAHGRRIIHRDLKPSNVMLAADGRCKILDFGIAHQARSAAATQTSASGTPPYMAPEQVMGTVLPASDLYALGVMTYELLAGSRPFMGPDFLGPKMRGEFSPITRLRPGLPLSLDAFFSAALSADPQRRPADAASFRKAFDGCWDAGLARTVAG